MVTPACNPSAWEAEKSLSDEGRQPGAHSKLSDRTTYCYPQETKVQIEWCSCAEYHLVVDIYLPRKCEALSSIPSSEIKGSEIASAGAARPDCTGSCLGWSPPVRRRELATHAPCDYCGCGKVNSLREEGITSKMDSKE